MAWSLLKLNHREPVDCVFLITGNYDISFADLSDYNLMNASEKLEFEKLSGNF